jgi:hydrogenase/urease accessory protein HupE
MTGERPVRTILFSMLFPFLTLTSAQAHTIGISRGAYRLVGDSVEAELTFARPEMIAAVHKIDSNLDGTLSEHEVTNARGAVAATIVHSIDIRTPTAPCPGTLQEAALTEGDGLSVRALYQCEAAARGVSFSLPFLRTLAHGHRHIVTVTAADTTLQVVAYSGHADFHLPPIHPRQESQATPRPLGWSFFLLGIGHILTGYDHLLFLLGLILVGQRLRPLLVAITAFTVAHSLTLGLAALNVWAPSPALVEPLIALSVAYVGVENWFAKDMRRRWLITLPFGLIHGFGFAGALGEIALPRAQVPLALATFNLGVEAGQIAALAVVFPVVVWMHRQVWFAALAVRTASAGIALAGSWWFVTRVM